MKQIYLLSGVMIATTVTLTGCLNDKPRNLAALTNASTPTESTTTSIPASKSSDVEVVAVSTQGGDELLSVEKNIQKNKQEPIMPLITFNHAGVQKGSKFNICTREPCSTVEVLDFKQVDQRPAHSDIDLTIKTGYYDTETKTQTWDKETQKVSVKCSLVLPTIIGMGVTQVIPLNPNGLSSAWQNSGAFYTKACHNELDYMKVINKYQYNVAELPSG